nr:MAG TPA: Protein of unknown function (DUF1549) [Caudoviricetes sp.]
MARQQDVLSKAVRDFVRIIERGDGNDMQVRCGSNMLVWVQFPQWERKHYIKRVVCCTERKTIMLIEDIDYSAAPEITLACAKCHAEHGFKTFTEEQAKEAQAFIDEYKAQMYRMFEYIIEEWYDYDSGDLKEFLTSYTAEDVEWSIFEEAEQYTQEYCIPESVADYLANSNFEYSGGTPFDWQAEQAESEEDINDAIARCVLWGRMATHVIEDFLANVATTIYDTDKATGLEYAEDWGVSVKLFA